MVYSYATGSYQDGDFEGGSSFLTSKSAIEEVKDFHPRRGFYSQIFLVQKRSGGWKPVVDFFRLNQFVLCPHFKMETLESIRLALQKDDWVTSLYLKDAYFQIQIHRRSRRYLRFFFEGKVYQFRALPFGLSVSLHSGSQNSPDPHPSFTWTIGYNLL